MELNDINNFVRQDAIKNQSFILSIQLCFDLDNPNDFKDGLENNNQHKIGQIKNFCNENYASLIQNFLEYYKLRQQIKDLLSEMNLFEQKLEKIRKSNAYDTREINLKRIQLHNINRVQKNIRVIQEAIGIALKAIKSSQSDQLTTSIRNVEKIKNHSIIVQPNKLNKIQNIFVQITPLIYKKVQMEADNKIVRWQNYAKQKQLEIGLQILQQCDGMIRNSTMNNRSSLIIGDKQSIYFERPSQSTNQIGRLSMLMGKQRVSIMPDSRISAMPSRLSNLNQSSRMATSTVRISLNNSKNQEPVAWSFNAIEYSSLKQPQFIYETMKQKSLFISQLKLLRQSLLYQICEAEQVHQISELAIYLGNIVGFFVIDMELQKIFKDYDQTNQLMIDSFRTLEKHIKQIFLRIPTEDLITLKKELLQFGISFGKMNLESIFNSMNKILMDQFKIFCRRKIAPIRGILSQKIQQDGFQYVKTYNREDYGINQKYQIKDLYVQILDIPVKEEKQDDIVKLLISTRQQYVLPFSQTVAECILQINWVDYSSQLIYSLSMNGLSSWNDTVFDNLDLLYQEIFDIIRNFIKVQSDSKDPLQLCQLALNMNYLFNSIKYYRKQIENFLQITSNKDQGCISVFNDAKQLCEGAISDQLNHKVYQMLEQLKNVNWEPQTPNKGPDDFFVLLVEYLETIFSTITLMLPEFVRYAIYFTLQFINQQIWKILIEDIKYFNILSLVNLNQNIICLARICNTTFQNHNQLMESIKEIREFIQLFLVDKPEDFLDSNKRKTTYVHLNGQKLKLVFMKYKKIKHPKYPIVRCRDLEKVSKKIQDNPGQF